MTDKKEDPFDLADKLQAYFDFVLQEPSVSRLRELAEVAFICVGAKGDSEEAQRVTAVYNAIDNELLLHTRQQG